MAKQLEHLRTMVKQLENLKAMQQETQIYLMKNYQKPYHIKIDLTSMMPKLVSLITGLIMDKKLGQLHCNCLTRQVLDNLSAIIL